MQQFIKTPPIGFGTFGSDRYTSEQVKQAVMTAIEMGFRLFDCASVYGNENEIGETFSEAFEKGIVKREDLFITSKVWNDKHGDGEVIASCKKSLADLKLDYIDLYFVHWPFPNYHAPGCDVSARNPDSRPFFTEEFMAVWKQMEQLKREGLVKYIGMSNMTIPKFEAVLPLCEIAPDAHEMELHPAFQQTELFNYCVERGIKPIGYCPIGSPNRPERDKTENDVSDTEMPEIKALAEKYSITPHQVCIKWALQNGQVPIPFASQKKNIQSNYDCLTMPDFTEQEMESIKKADKDCRLVKGHVFLWEGASDWKALWDMSGKINGWND